MNFRNRLFEKISLRFFPLASPSKLRLAIRYLLLPLDTFYWQHSRRTGYQPSGDVWIIDGVVWSASSLTNLLKLGRGIPLVMTLKEGGVLVSERRFENP